MSKITLSFVLLVCFLTLSSIVYIVHSDTQKQNLQTQLTTQTEELNSLKTQIENQAAQTGSIAGATTTTPTATITPTGMLSGSVILTAASVAELTQASNTEITAVVICAKNTRSQQEICTDTPLNTKNSAYPFTLELPGGTYELYALLPPLDIKMYYTDTKTCTTDSVCTPNEAKKRLIEVQVEDEQLERNIYFSLI